MLILLAVFFALLQPCGPLFAQQRDDAPPDAVRQLPALVTSLLDEDKPTEAVTACRALLDAQPDRRDEILPQLARALEAAGEPGEAVEAWVELVADRAPSLAEVDVLLRLAPLARDAGGAKQAAKAYQVVTDYYPALIEEYIAKAPPGYSGNRRVLDQALVYARAAEALAALGEGVARTDRLRDFVRRYPDAPGARGAWLALGRAAGESGEWQEATACALRVLSYSGDRTRPHRTELRDNQAYLDAISTPNDASTIRECLALLWKAAEHLQDAVPPDDDALDRVAQRWQEAERASYAVVWTEEWLAKDAAEAAIFAGAHYPGEGEQWAPNPAPPLPVWHSVVAACAGTPLLGVAHLALAQWLHYGGAYEDAAAHYRAAAASDALPATASAWIAFEQGELALHTGRIEEALARFSECSDPSDRGLAAEASFRAAECLECLGRVDEARTACEELTQSDAAPVMVRYRARYALQRLTESAASLRSLADSRSLAYVGQDRLTQGDWRARGRDFFAVLCYGGWWDLFGGLRAPLFFRPGTTDPERESYFWHGGHDPAPCWLYDPVNNDRGPRNWDDGGEKYTPGTGPDLIVNYSVPAGSFRMGLYFVNDRNYYEPNRRYMVYVQDAASGDLLAAAPVRDFVSGTYWQLHVTGPRDLRIRIWRNMSLNTLLTGIFLDDLSALPAWDEVAVAALSKRHVHTPPAETLARLSPAWERYRETRRSGASRPLETGVLADFVDEVTLTLDDYQAGRALDALSAWFREGGYTEQSCLLQDRALALVATQSPRRHADMLLDAIETYGARVTYGEQGNVGDFSESERVGPLYLAWVQPRLAEYFALTREPRSLVSPNDLLQRAREYYEYQTQRFWLARPFFEAACEGDLGRLPGHDVLKYSWTVDEDERAAVLAGLRARDEPGGVAEWLVLSHMTTALLASGDLEAAAEACRALQDSDGPVGTKQSNALHLALSLWERKDAESARTWAARVLQLSEEGPYAEQARRLLGHVAAGKPYFDLPWEKGE